MLAFIGMPGPTEMIVIGIIAVLLFGSRLPGVARDLGRSLISLKAGYKEVEREIEETEKTVKREIADAEKAIRQ